MSPINRRRRGYRENGNSFIFNKLEAQKSSSVVQTGRRLASVTLVAVFVVATPAVRAAPAKRPQLSQTEASWSSAKIPAPVAKVLMGRRGHLYLVDETFDRISYVAVPSFPVGVAAPNGHDLPFVDPGADGVLGMAGTLPSGERVAYVATEGRTPSEVADTLYALARQIRSEERRAIGVPTIDILILVLAAVVVLVVGTLIVMFVVVVLTGKSEPQDLNYGGYEDYEESNEELYY